MGAAFCFNCGKPLAAGSSFCMSCGTAVPTAAAAAGGSAPAPSPPPMPSVPVPPAAMAPLSGAMNAPMDGPSLTARLGLEGKRQFIVQHQILALGHSYRVMDHEKRHLFAVKGDVAQQRESSMMGSLLSQASGGSSYMAGIGERSTDLTYSLVDAQGTIIGSFTKQGAANDSIFTLTDLQGRPWVIVTLNRGGFGGITATAVYPDGRPMMQTHGNLLRHDFRIRDPNGAELAKVHEAWAAVRDTYHVDTEGNLDPLYPLVFAILIDYEKVK
jgi:uncharacterized protein YxjI